MSLAQGDDCRMHGRTGREPVVDQDYGPTSDFNGRPLSSVGPFPPLKLASLRLYFRVNQRPGNLQALYYFGVKHHVAAARDRTHPELRIAWHAELSHDEDIERRSKGFRYLEGDRDSTAWKP
jgi:hypothetical protein